MDKSDIVQALGKLHHLLLPIKQPWFIIGTSNLLLAGFNVEPNDIDILTDKSTASLIHKFLKPFEVPVQLKKDDEKFRSAFSRYNIEGVSIELMGDLQVNTNAGWVDVLPLVNSPHQINLNENFFTIPSNADQIKIYTLFGRQKDETVLKLLNAT